MIWNKKEFQLPLMKKFLFCKLDMLNVLKTASTIFSTVSALKTADQSHTENPTLQLTHLQSKKGCFTVTKLYNPSKYLNRQEWVEYMNTCNSRKFNVESPFFNSEKYGRLMIIDENLYDNYGFDDLSNIYISTLDEKRRNHYFNHFFVLGSQDDISHEVTKAIVASCSPCYFNNQVVQKYSHIICKYSKSDKLLANADCIDHHRDVLFEFLEKKTIEIGCIADLKYFLASANSYNTFKRLILTGELSGQESFTSDNQFTSISEIKFETEDIASIKFLCKFIKKPEQVHTLSLKNNKNPEILDCMQQFQNVKSLNLTGTCISYECCQKNLQFLSNVRYLNLSFTDPDNLILYDAIKSTEILVLDAYKHSNGSSNETFFKKYKNAGRYSNLKSLQIIKEDDNMKPSLVFTFDFDQVTKNLKNSLPEIRHYIETF